MSRKKNKKPSPPTDACEDGPIKAQTGTPADAEKRPPQEGVEVKHLTEGPKAYQGTKKFSQDLKIWHDKPFELVPVILEDGPFKGQRVFLVKDKFFRFLDLPAEIRNTIYKRLLVEGDGYIFLTSSHGSRKKGPKIHQTGDWILGHKRLEKEKHMFEDSTSLLRVNRQMHREALAVLYANNNLDIDSITTLKRFTDIIGPGLKHLTYLRISPDGYAQRTLRGAMRNLRMAENLRTIHLYHADLCEKRGRSAAKFVEDYKLLLQALEKSYKARNIDFSVADLIHIDYVECQWCLNESFEECEQLKNSCGCSCFEARMKAEKLTREIGEMVAKKFAVEYRHEKDWWSFEEPLDAEEDEEPCDCGMPHLRRIMPHPCPCCSTTEKGRPLSSEEGRTV